MDSIKAIVIDDEKMPREVLKLKLAEHCKQIEVVAEAMDIEDGYQKIIQYDPHLVFLDITMPGGNGFDLLDKFISPKFDVVMVTAYDEYALEAYKKNALGYLVKPITAKELIRVVHHASDIIKSKLMVNQYKGIFEKNPNTDKNTITIHHHEGLEILPIHEIIRCEGWEKYTYFYMPDKKILSTQNIGKYKEILISNGFFHAHKSHIVNRRVISGYDKEGFLILSDQTRIPLARRRKHIFNEWVES